MHYKQISIFALNHWPSGVLWGFFNIISHNLPPLKTGNTHFVLIMTNNFWNLHETTEVTGFMRSSLQYLIQITTLGKRGPHSSHGLQTDFENFKKPLSQCVLCGPFSFISHKSHPWKTGTTHFALITKKSFQNLQQTIELKGFMRTSFNYFIQIIPLENGDHTVWMGYKQKKNENFHTKTLS